MKDTPTAIRLDPAGDRLEIDWGDGHTSTFHGAFLRRICPCAGCRGHAPGEIEPPSAADCAGVRVTGAHPVGGYALHLDLTDGHDSGIYSFDWLREHCPCEDCSA